MKVAIVSCGLPPSWSGQSVVLHRLLEGIAHDAYCLIGSAEDTKTQTCFAVPPLAGRLYKVPPAPRPVQQGRTRIWPALLIDLAHIVHQIVARGRRIAEILRGEGCGAVVACTGGDLLDWPAAYYAGRITGAAFYPYVFDDYASQWVGPYNPWRLGRFREPLGKLLERLTLRRAAGVFVHNEFMAARLAKRYGVRATVVHNPCDTLAYRVSLSAETSSEPRVRDEQRIVYTGAVYEAHFDSFARLLSAIVMLDRPGLKLHIYTAQTASWLEARGIRGPVSIHAHVEATLVPALQRRADVLFLPLAFESPYPELIHTTAPSKMGEYLAARSPVLVHTPADSFVSDYFRRYRCGLVVDVPSTEALAEGLRRILDDENLRAELSRNASVRADSDFAIESSRDTFCRAIGMAWPEPSGRVEAGDSADRNSATAGAKSS